MDMEQLYSYVPRELESRIKLETFLANRASCFLY